MKKILFVLLILSAIMLNTTKGTEPLYYYGGYLAYNYNIHSANFSELAPVPNCCPSFQSGSGSGFAIGGLFEIPLKPGILLGFRLGYSSIGATLLSPNVDIGNFDGIDLGAETPQKVFVDYTLDSKIDIIGIEPYVSFEFFDHFVSSLGLKAAYVMTGKFSQQEKINSPNDAVFYSTRSTIQNNYSNVDIPNLNKFMIFGVLGLGYELPIGKNAYLIPEIRYYMSFMNITSAVTWIPTTWQFGAAIEFPINPPEEVKPPDTIKYEKPIEPELPPLFTSSIEATGISADGTRQKNPTLVIEETEVEEGFPLLPHVFFKENSSDISQTGLHLLNKQQIAGFREDSLPWNTMKIYSEMLNIVGYRMSKMPNEKITITGCNNNLGNEANNLALSKQRADAVKNYLTDVWEIDANRINVKSQNLPDNLANNDIPDGQEENQRAEISSSNFEMIQPIYLKKISRKSSPPVIEISPTIISDEGVHDYDIEVTQGKDTIRSYKGEKPPTAIFWKTEEKPLPMLESPINIDLTALDSSGQMTKAGTSLSIQQLTLHKKRYELKDDKRYERFSLIVFDYDKAELKANHKKILDNVKERIQPNSTVTIEGYADRTGEAEYNVQLAQRRCDEVEKLLQSGGKSAKFITKAFGNSVLLYDNKLPQGRSYCRTVKITIETPVK